MRIHPAWPREKRRRPDDVVPNLAIMIASQCGGGIEVEEVDTYQTINLRLMRMETTALGSEYGEISVHRWKPTIDKLPSALSHLVVGIAAPNCISSHSIGISRVASIDYGCNSRIGDQRVYIRTFHCTLSTSYRYDTHRPLPSGLHSRFFCS
jgi:hypothetical protein